MGIIIYEGSGRVCDDGRGCGRQMFTGRAEEGRGVKRGEAVCNKVEETQKIRQKAWQGRAEKNTTDKVRQGKTGEGRTEKVRQNAGENRVEIEDYNRQNKAGQGRAG